jgi:hypothetical protein
MRLSLALLLLVPSACSRSGHARPDAGDGVEGEPELAAGPGSEAAEAGDQTPVDAEAARPDQTDAEPPGAAGVRDAASALDGGVSTTDAAKSAASDDASAAGDGAGAASTGDVGLPGEPSDAGARDASDASASSCATHTLSALHPEVMIVLDRSDSMRTTIEPSISCVDPLSALLIPQCLGVDCAAPLWQGTTACGGTLPAGEDHWAPAVAVIKSYTNEFDTKLNFGLTVFPGRSGPPDAGGEQCAPGSELVPTGPGHAAPIATQLDGTKPSGNSPLSSTLASVRERIATKRSALPLDLPPQHVLLVTDGAPNCVGNNPAADLQAHTATLSGLDGLMQDGVKTHVIGFDSPANPTQTAQLTEYAQHGGGTAFYLVQNGSTLSPAFEQLMRSLAVCSYQLDVAIDTPAQTRVTLDGQPVAWNAPDGFVAAGKEITFQGSACAALQDDSRVHVIGVQTDCVK